MPPKYLRTSDIARAVGVHPNTVRLYEAWGFLPPVPRSPKGYRLYTGTHLDIMRLARTARQALDMPRPDEEICSAADRWLSTLTTKEEQALTMIAQVEAMIGKPRIP